MDEAGNIYVWQRLTGNIQIFSPAGDPVSVLALDPVLPDLTTKPVVELRVDGGKLYIRQADKIELFRTYDLKTGKLLGIVNADTRVLSASFAGGVWPAGKVIPFAINYKAAVGAPMRMLARASANPWSAWRKVRVSTCTEISASLQASASNANLASGSPRFETGGSCRKSPKKTMRIPPKGAGSMRTIVSTSESFSMNSADSMEISSMMRHRHPMIERSCFAYLLL